MSLACHSRCYLPCHQVGDRFGGERKRGELTHPRVCSRDSALSMANLDLDISDGTHVKLWERVFVDVGKTRDTINDFLCGHNALVGKCQRVLSDKCPLSFSRKACAFLVEIDEFCCHANPFFFVLERYDSREDEDNSVLGVTESTKVFSPKALCLQLNKRYQHLPLELTKANDTGDQRKIRMSRLGPTNAEVQEVVSRYANLHQQFQDPVILFTSWDNDLEGLDILLRSGKCSVQDKDPFGMTALHFAAFSDMGAIARRILEDSDTNAVANIINSTNKDLDTPLILAAYHNHHNVAKLLLDHGADPFRKDGQGFSALKHARKQGNAECIALLQPYAREEDELEESDDDDDDDDDADDGEDGGRWVVVGDTGENFQGIGLFKGYQEPI